MLDASVGLVVLLLLAACQAPGPGDVHAPGQGAATLMRVADETRAGGDLSTAVGLYRRVHEMSPADPKPLARLGSTLTQMKSYTEAAQAYRGALELAPNDPDLRRGMAIVLLSLGQPEPAVIQLEKALAHDHDDARLYSALGVARDLMGRHDLAQAAYLDGLRLAPKSTSLRNNYALSLALSGDFGAAVSTLADIAEDVGAPPRYRLNLALVYGLAGDDKKAAAIAHTTLDEASVRNNLAYYAMLRGMGDKARTAAIIGGQVHGNPTERPVPAAVAEAAPPAAADNSAAPAPADATPTVADDKDMPPPAPVPAEAAASDAPLPDASGPPVKLTRPDAAEPPADATAQPAATEAAPAPAVASGDATTTAGDAPPPAATAASDTPSVPAPSAAQASAQPTDSADAAAPAPAAPAPAAPPVALKGGAKTKPAAAAAAGGFVLQFGAFSVEANAHKLADRLKRKGHDVSVVPHQDAAGRQLYIVRGGSYANAGEAEVAARRIHDAERVPTVVVRQHAPGPA
jgi:Flp pilus assembly protein TadD